MSSKHYEESGYGFNVGLLIILYYGNHMFHTLREVTFQEHVSNLVYQPNCEKSCAHFEKLDNVIVENVLQSVLIVLESLKNSSSDDLVIWTFFNRGELRSSCKAGMQQRGHPRITLRSVGCVHLPWIL